MKNLIIGTLAKAIRDDAGRPIIRVLATGPKTDAEGEHMTSEALDQFGAAADAGQIALTPSHDVPLPLARSIGHSSDADGNMLIDFLAEESDPVGMRVWTLAERGDLRAAVSIGANHATRMGKAITGITADESLHTALCFLGRQAYPDAAVVGAMLKTVKDHDELHKHGWSDEQIAKAFDGAGNWVPPTFGERIAQWKLQDEMPELMDCLLWTVSDILDPYSSGDKRALLQQTFAEFSVYVLGEVAAAEKTDDVEPELEKETPAPEPEPEPDTGPTDRHATGDGGRDRGQGDRAARRRARRAEEAG